MFSSLNDFEKTCLAFCIITFAFFIYSNDGQFLILTMIGWICYTLEYIFSIINYKKGGKNE